MHRHNTSKAPDPASTSYRSAAGALRSNPRPSVVSSPRRHDAVQQAVHHLAPSPRTTPCRVPQRPQRREALRENTPPWAVRLEHRFPGKLINVSRRGLSIETREAPPFYSKGRLRVDVRGETVILEVAVQWCRLVGLEQIETARGVETAPRFQLGLGCDDPALQRLGAPPACGGARRRTEGC